MKNKHLVLLFLLVLLLGYVGRRLPWRCQSDLRSRFITAPEAVYRIQISRTGQPDLFIEHTTAGWMAEQEGRTVPVSSDTMAALLGMLGQPAFFKPLADREGAAAFDSAAPIRLRLSLKDRPEVLLQFGLETPGPDGPWTLVRFAQHKSVYRVRGAFRTRFDRTLDDFRSRTLLPFEAEQVCRVAFHWPPDSSILWEKIDTANWQLASTSSMEQSPLPLQYWLNAVSQLHNLPFADFFDESREEEWLSLSVAFTACDGRTCTLRFFVLEPPDIPEDIQRLRRQGVLRLPRYVAHSSANPHNYFVLTDADMAARLCAGP
ncbi:MAG: DUF4340 domain-containing protein [Saprospiraceae bacterium]|nr:DUF4340 domain-containing protein [Saprospiraceae bacterium]MDW8228616.1 DUF4340 domain-containing protein [Saprospiraceae bacterium]